MKYVSIVYLLLFQLIIFPVYPQTKLKIVNPKTGKGISNVTIVSNTYPAGDVTDEDGNSSGQYFPIDTLVFYHILYQTKTLIIKQNNQYETIYLVEKDRQLEEIKIISTGYQNLPIERFSGSFELINEKSLKRNPSDNILSRIATVVPGLLVNEGGAKSSDLFLIRGRGTISADASPLIVLDDMPFDGSLETINPETVESVIILKDATAASIWGARAGNGVIVIKTKRNYSNKIRITFHSNSKWANKPDLSSVKFVNSKDRIEWEKYLYKQGKYKNAAIAGTLSSKVSPIPQVAEMLIANVPESEIELLKKNNVNDEILRHFYQKSLVTQNNLHISSGGERMNYQLWGALLNAKGNLVGNKQQRIHVKQDASIRIIPKLLLNVGFQYVKEEDSSTGNLGINNKSRNGSYSPYAQLADEHGQALPYHGYYRQGFIDTVGKGALIDWNYYPLDDFKHHINNERLNSLLTNLSLNYQLSTNLFAELKYQNQLNLTHHTNYSSLESFAARDIINRYAQISPSGLVHYPFPVGGILNESFSKLNSNQGRIQLNYNNYLSKYLLINISAGSEIREKRYVFTNNNRYGVQPEISTSVPLVDYLTYFKQNTSTSTARIFLSNSQFDTTVDRFYSLFGNMTISYKDTYVLNGTIRKDQANLFGVNSNLRGSPFWSIGAAWLLNNNLLKIEDHLSLLKIRVTYGWSGNISRAASALPLITYSASGANHNFPYASIRSAPNEKLRWEKIGMFNVGLDLSSKNKRISGTVEYYHKLSKDLLASVPIDETLGLTNIYTNTANMQVKGVDLKISARILNNPLTWDADLVYSYSKNEITKYLMPTSGSTYSYAAGLYNIFPVIGKPMFSVYSYNWAGLSSTGSPQFYIDGEKSTNYSAIFSGNNLNQMVYNGPGQPVHFGSIRNTFSFKKISLGILNSYKLGYYFKIPSIYNSGFIDDFRGHSDYTLRWQKPGDEHITYVPAITFPSTTVKDNLYKEASVHVHSASHFRIEDILVSYEPRFWSKISSLRIYVLLENLGPLWLANKKNVDPYFNNVETNSIQTTAGISLTF